MPSQDAMNDVREALARTFGGEEPLVCRVLERNRLATHASVYVHLCI